MPPPDAVAGEELPSSGPRQPDDVLEVGRRRGDSAHGGGVERAADDRERDDAGGAAQRFEGTRRYVLVRDAVPERVQGRADEDGLSTRAQECARGGAGRNVQGHDHI